MGAAFPYIMIPADYSTMSDLALLQLCIWREARGEGWDGKRGVGHVVQNRTYKPKWWNAYTPYSYKSVILQPYQFSSFNADDPQNNKFPADDDPSFADCCAVALGVMSGRDADNTEGATHYYDISLPEFPHSWGNPHEYVHTADIGRLKFFRFIG